VTFPRPTESPTMKKTLTACLASTLVALGGCSGETGPKTMRVWGEVTYDGKPVNDGTIDFTSPDGSSPAQGSIQEGRYDIPAPAGPVAGKTYKVSITALAKTGKTVRNLMPAGDDTMEEYTNTIPPEYNSRSKLEASISDDSSKNEFGFKLDKPPASRK
jgi:hypothetical protein